MSNRWKFVVMLLGQPWIMDYDLTWEDCLDPVDQYPGITRGCEVQD